MTGADGAPGTRPIFLVGFMGAGKSTVGRLLAGRIGWAFRDTDEEVARREGLAIEAIFSERGEGYFRRVEWEVLQQLEPLERVVVATGGGLFLGAAQRRWMKGRGRTVWLDAPLGICAERVGSGSGRPLWTTEEPSAFHALFDKRRACYGLADYRLDAGRGPGALVEEIIVRLGLSPPSPPKA